MGGGERGGEGFREIFLLGLKKYTEVLCRLMNKEILGIY